MVCLTVYVVFIIVLTVLSGLTVYVVFIIALTVLSGMFNCLCSFYYCPYSVKRYV